MKLLIVTQAVDRDDAILGFFHRWIEEFSKHYEHVHVICLGKGNFALPKNVSVHSLGKDEGVSRLVYLLRFYKYIWSLRKEYDAVFVHMNPEYVVLGGKLWWLMGKRVALWYVHKHVGLWLWRAAMFASVIFTASKESFRLASKKVRILGHGIDTERFVCSVREKNDVLHIITVGRITKSKRLLEMLLVLDELARQRTVSFTVIGEAATREDHTYKEEFTREFRKRSYAREIRRVAHEQLPQALCNSSVFLHMSTTGSVDKAVLEALSCGVPVVTTSEAFKDTPAHYVSSDEPRAVADALLKAETSDPAALREYVRKNNSLPALINKIAAELSR